MKNRRMIVVSLLGLAGPALVPQQSAHAQEVAGALPPVPTPPNIVTLEPVEQLGTKYDASRYGTPPQDLYTLSASEDRGRILYRVGPNPSNDPTFGKAQYSQCHNSVDLPGVMDETDGKNAFSMSCFANSGVPENLGDPDYEMVDPTTDPTGYNTLGTNYVDYSLGANAIGGLDGSKFYNKTPGDIAEFRGRFLTPTVRNKDMRPYPTFVK